MSKQSTDYQIAKATAAQYVREVAKAQIAFDRFKSGDVYDPSEAGLRQAAARLKFCKEKAEEWEQKMDDVLADEDFEL